MSELVHEIRIALRAMARDKSFAVPVLLTLTLCLAANATVFTVLHSVVLRPLPLADPERLVAVSNSFPKAGVVEADNSVPDYYDRKAGVGAFEDLALYRTVGRTLGTAVGAERVIGMAATPSLFRVLRAGAWRGRVLQESDGVPGQEHQVVLSYALWQRLFGGRLEAVGRDLHVNGVPHRVIGIMPRDFLFLDAEVGYWLPTAFTAEDRADDRRYSNSYQMVGRLRPGATLAQAQEQLRALATANLERSPELRQPLTDAGYTTNGTLLQERVVRDVRRPLFLLWAGVLFVLTIGCVNVANLALVRTTARGRELAARQALGAGPRRLLRQLLVEGLLLTLAAAVLGVFAAGVLLRSLAGAAADTIPRASEIHLGGATLLMTAGLALVVGIVLALIPLLYGARTSLALTMRQESRSGTAVRGVRTLRRSLVAAQVAFAFVLLLGAGLLIASFRELLQVRPGFASTGVLTGKVSLPAALYREDADVAAWTLRARERLQAMPGVAAVGLGTSPPLVGDYSDSVILAEGYLAQPGESVVSPAQNAVSPGYFDALRIPLREGRAIDDRDTATSQAVLVVDEKLAKRFWPRESAVGKRMYLPDTPEDILRPGPNTRWLTVVGVVGAVKQRGLVAADEREGAYYFPLAQLPSRTLTLIVRSVGPAPVRSSEVRRQLAALDPQLPFYNVLTMEERVDQSVAGRRASLQLATGFGVLALLLATLGIYGALSYGVSQRTREIGIRMALGGESSSVFRLVLGEGAALLAVGLAVGFAGLFALRKALAGELYGVTPFEPGVLAGVTALLAIVALVACALPARRAARIDPAIALTD